MASATYYVVVPFGRDEEGNIVPGEAKEVQNGELAQRRARSLVGASGNIGAVAFSRSDDPRSGEFLEGVILARFGEVDLQALQG